MRLYAFTCVYMHLYAFTCVHMRARETAVWLPLLAPPNE